jgi:hypothetical protein
MAASGREHPKYSQITQARQSKPGDAKGVNASKEASARAAPPRSPDHCGIVETSV